MADNNQGFQVPSRGDQELVYSTNTGDSSATPPVPATGLVMPLYREVNPDGSTSYYKMDGTTYTPDAAVETIDTKPIRVPLGQEVLNLDGSAKSFSSVPANAVLAEVQVHVGEEHLAWTTTGVSPDPTSHIGRLTMAGKQFDIEGQNELAAFKAVSLANDGSAFGSNTNIYAEFYNVTEDGTYAK